MKPRTLTRLSLMCAAWCVLSARSEVCAQETTPLPPPAARSAEDLIKSLSKCVKADWVAKFRAPVVSNLNSRPQIALVLGGAFADGYLAAQAEDPQQCRNISRDLLTLASSLGVKAELLDRSRSLADSAQKRDWPVLRRELELAEADLGAALRKHEDEGLARLVTLGEWMRGTEIVASILSDNYSENGAALLRQPALAHLLGSGIEQLGEKFKADPALELVRTRLGAVEQLLGGSADTAPSLEEVKKLSATLSSILLEMTARRN